MNNILTYVVLFVILVYSAISLNYYNKLAKERMTQGDAFCSNVNYQIGEIMGLQAIATAILVLTLFAIVMEYYGNDVAAYGGKHVIEKPLLKNLLILVILEPSRSFNEL